MWHVLMLFPALLALPAVSVVAFLDVSVDNNLNFTSSIDQIDDKPDVPLVILCTFKPEDHVDVVAHLSLTISKRGFGTKESREVARLTGSLLDEADDFVGGTATGELSKQRSYLRIEFTHPTMANIGEYMCHSVGLTAENKIVASELSLTIRPTTRTADEIWACVKGKDARPPSLTVAKQSLVACGAPEESWFQTLSQVKNTEFSEDPADIWGVTGVFNSSSFYIFTAPGISRSHGEGICTSNLGYLVEINTENEFRFISDALNILRETKAQTFVEVGTGAYWKVSDGAYKFFAHPGDRVYTGHWYGGARPHDYSDYNRLFLYDRLKQGELLMAEGIATNEDELAFLCEISKDIQ